MDQELCGAVGYLMIYEMRSGECSSLRFCTEVNYEQKEKGQEC